MEVAAPLFAVMEEQGSIDEAEHLLGEVDDAAGDLAPLGHQLEHVIVGDDHSDGGQQAHDVAAYDDDSEALGELDPQVKAEHENVAD